MYMTMYFQSLESRNAFLRFHGDIQLLIIKQYITIIAIRSLLCWELLRSCSTKSKLLRTRIIWEKSGELSNKSLIETKKKCDKSISGKDITSDPKTIANAFNNYFVNVGPTLAYKIPDQPVDFSRYMPPPNESSLFLTPALANLSLLQGVFPQDLKIALICPIYKAKDPMIFSNYHPISKLSLFSKILERLMYKRLS